MPPELIGGRYRLGRAIGQGGMGTVWLCRDEVLHRDVAVKRVGLLPGESVTDSARAMREARSSAALSHRNVVTIFDVVEDAGAVWLVMELVPSRSLSEIIKEEGPLEPAAVAALGAELADGLAAAHAAGIMHRDVKPGNVLVRADGTAMISDFGIARAAGDPTLTQSGMVTGTPSYFAPELARGESPGPPADVWALGATLYAAVEGRPPYQAQANPIAVLHDIARRQPPAPRRAGLLEPALLAMMARDPAQRWTMDDARLALRKLRARAEDDGTPTRIITAPSPAPTTSPRSTQAPAPQPTPETTAGPSARPPDVERPPAAAAPDRPRRLRGLYAALLAGLLLVAGLGYALLNGPDDDGPKASDTPAASESPSRNDTASRTPTTAAASPSTGGTPSSSPTSSAASSPTASATSRSPSASPSSSGTSGGGPVAAFLRGYFSAAPGGTDAAWAQLGPGEQAQGRAAYDRFWQGISSVEVTDVEPGAGGDFVDATVTYRTTDRRVSVERKRFSLVRSPSGGYLIDGEQPVR